MNLPFIADPWFYVVTVPAVLLLGVSKSGFGVGFGSLVVPIMALTVTVPQAAAILMPVLLLTAEGGDALRRRAREAGFTVIHKPVRPAALRAWLAAG